MDGRIACSTGGLTCDPGPIAPGRHEWYVIAHNGCGARFSQPSLLTVTGVPTSVGSPSPPDQGALGTGLTLAWTAASPGSAFDVLLDGTPVCLGLSGTSCTLAAPPSSGSHHWQVLSVTGCGGNPGPAWSFTAP